MKQNGKRECHNECRISSEDIWEFSCQFSEKTFELSTYPELVYIVFDTKSVFSYEGEEDSNLLDADKEIVPVFPDTSSFSMDESML